MRKYLIAAAGIGMIASANGAFAASATSNLNVSVTVSGACVVSADPMNFGSFTGSIPANTTANTDAKVICNSGTSYSVSFASASAVGTATASMTSGGNTIPASLAVDTTSKLATGGTDLTNITGTIVAGVTAPAVGVYNATVPIYVNY